MMRLGPFLLGAAIGMVLVLSASGGDLDRMTFGDGVFAMGNAS